MRGHLQKILGINVSDSEVSQDARALSMSVYDFSRMKPGAVADENAPLYPARWLLWQLNLGAQIYIFGRKSDSGRAPL